MTSNAYTSWPQLEIDGNALTEALLPKLSSVIVDHHLHLPDMFSVVFDDGAQDVITKGLLHVGSAVRITATGLGQNDSQLLLSGEVTSLEAEYASGRDQTIVRGYDKSHRLHRGRKTESYQNVKISDVAQTVASRAGLDIGTIDDTGPVLPHVSQANVTDWEFLKARARELGYELGVADGKFFFRKPVASSTAPEPGDAASTGAEQLVYGRDLVNFRPRLTSSAQVSQVNVRAWDPATKSVLVGSATAGTTHVQVQDDPTAIAQPFGSPSFLVHDRPLATQSDVDGAAQSVAEQLGSAFAEAEGVAAGNPRLRAGTAVSVSQVADHFSGRYTLTRTRHVFDDDGYRTEFQVSGRQDRTLLGLTSLGATNGTASAGGQPISGVFVGQVTNNDDPNNLGRVKLQFPWLSDSYELDWARVTQVGAGPQSGVMFIPEVGDEVLCSCEFGDMRRLYVLSGLHNGQDTPDLGDELIDGGAVKRRGIVSRKGHKLVFFDDDSKSGIALLSSDGNLRISLNETNGEIHIHCQGKVTIDTDSGDIAINSGGDLTLTAQGNVDVNGQGGVKVETSAILEMSGELIKLN